MTTDIRYKYITWALVVVVLILGYLLWQRSNVSVSDVFRSAENNINDCENDIRQWSDAYLSDGESSEADKEILKGVLEGCRARIESAKEKLQ